MAITRTLRVISGTALTGALIFTSAPHATADQVRDDQWALTSLKAEAAWKTSKGEGETVAVIDDGVDADHPDLKRNVLKGKDFVNGGEATPASGEVHGTAMASLIAGHGHGPGNNDGMIGLAPEAKILPIRNGGFNTDKAIKYAVDNGASVINISQGNHSYSTDEANAVAYALKKGVPIVAPTGNSGEGKVEYPAAYPGVIAVGGVQEGGTIWPKSNSGKQTLLSAPASRIVQAGGASGSKSYGMSSGTSDSTAYTSAAAALIKAEHPDLTAGQVVNRLTETAELPSSAKGSKLPDEQYGYGSIRPHAALTEDIPKGSKYGPLSVPQELKDEAEAEAMEKESDALQKESDRQAVILWAITGVIGLLFIAAVVLTIVLVARRRKKKRSGGPGAPDGSPYPPGQAPGYGMPPHQQQPMPPQPTAPPRQPPHN